jgi:OmpA-OmpF porin, OOP family
MSTNLIDLAKSYLSPKLIQTIGDELGEHPERMEQAAQAGIPSILAGFMNLASSTGANRLLDMLKQAPPELAQLGGFDKVLANPASLLSGSSLDTLIKYGQTLLNLLFGSKLSSMTDLITKTSGIKASSASSMLGILAPLLMGILRKETVSEGLSAAGVTKLLMDQKGVIARYAPAGLANALGLNSLTDLGSVADSIKTAGAGAAREAGRTAAAAAHQGGSFLRWAAPLALLALVVGGLFYFLSQQGQKPLDKTELAQDTRPVSDTAGKNIERISQNVAETGKTLTTDGKALLETTKKLVSISLPGNVKIDVPESSYVEKLVTCLTDNTGASSSKSVVADDLRFDEATDKLDSESSSATILVAKVMKAFGNAKLKIVGHSDNVGDPEVNKKRSLARATAVKDALVEAGAPGDRITVEGAGAEHPIASNDTKDGRAANRRMELAIVSK